ncbi:TonB-dependent copper receptor [Pseudoalteromonas sp. MMG022]|uniref:TonB-dependent copper receptor n=1 Tax=Pseudoalteromonas sp. MMG022 TaxID=2909978 RepID=UPI001F00B5B6|nr:TonB-dependent copper receptor [Pseudoalteromonas sp. MMG022]MCF6435075.1 TonB-dependent copper receptor [Pseudoalteromonas sp. MMG022]
MKHTLLCSALFSVFYSYANDDKFEHLVVIAPMQSPMLIVTDPKQPRQPLPAQDGADLLSSITGFSLIKKAAASGDPIFRGMAGSRLNIITDGGLTLGGCGSRMDPPSAYITPQAYDTLTVIKGPQSVKYGSGNSAATIIFERNQERLQAQQTTGFVNATLASAKRRTINTDIKAGTPDYYVRISGNVARADDYHDGDNTRVHSAYQRWNLDTELAYTPTDDNIISVSLGRSDGEVAYADRMMDGSLFKRTHAGLYSKWLLAINGINHVEAKWYYNEVDHIMDNYSLRPFTPNMMMKAPSASNPDRRSVGGKIMFDASPTTNQVFVFGVDYQQDHHRNRSTRDQFNHPVEHLPRLTDAKFDKVGLFAEHEYTLSASEQIVSGLRYDRWHAKDYRQEISIMSNRQPNPTSNMKRTDDLLSGFTRYERHYDTHHYFIGFGHAQRFPDYWELFGGNRASVQSLSAFDTDVEKTNQLDLGTQYTHKKWHGTISMFYNRIDDFILIDNAFGQGPMQRRVTRNIEAETFGAEAEASYNITKQWRASTSINYVRGSNLTDGIALAQQPPLQVRFTLDYQTDNWRLGMLWRVVSAQHRVALAQGNIAGQDIGPSRGFGVLAFNALYQPSPDVSVSMGVDNALDQTYSEHLSKSGAAVSGYSQIDRINEAGTTLWANLNWYF